MSSWQDAQKDDQSREAQYMSLPVSEFENLCEQTRVRGEMIEKLREAVRWNEEQRGIQAREIERLREELHRVAESRRAMHEAAQRWQEELEKEVERLHGGR